MEKDEKRLTLTHTRKHKDIQSTEHTHISTIRNHSYNISIRIQWKHLFQENDNFN